MALFAILLVGLIATASSAPLSNQNQKRCSRHCAIGVNDSLRFIEGSKYTYSYSGTAAVESIAQGKSEEVLPWKALVDLTWLTSCDVEVTIREPEVMGTKGQIISENISKLPLVIGMKNGLITDVCAHPDDEPASLNLKKGIISSLQNVLPSFEPTEKQVFEEESIIGRCPTSYTVARKADNIEIVKEVVQSQCSLPGPMSPIAKILSAVDDSKTECRQTITNGIVTSVECSSKQIVRLPSKLSLQASTKSSLVYQRKVVAAHNGMDFEPRRTAIAFETVPQSKEQRFEQMAIAELKQACAAMETQNEQLPRIMARVVTQLYRVPQDFGVKLMGMVRESKICNKNMEDLVWKAILSVYAPSSVRAVVHEIKNKQMSPVSASLYGLRLQFSGEASVPMIEELLSVVEDQEMPYSLVLASGSIVNRFCKTNKECLHEPSVQKLISKLSQQLESSCKSSKENSKDAAKSMRALKTLGNIGVLPREARESVLSCMMASQAAVSIRVAAGQALRKADMTRHEISPLVQILLKQHEDPEVRIAAYLAVIQRVSYLEASLILDAITREKRSQVKSFVLSHLQNVQHTSSPHLQSLRYKVAPLLVSQDIYTTLQHSRNFDLSSYLPGAQSGAAIDTNIIYSGSSMLPRQVQTNITVNAFGQVINIGEMAVRLEDVDLMITQLLEPLRDLSSGSARKVIQKVVEITRSVRRNCTSGECSQGRGVSKQVMDILSAGSSKSKFEGFLRILSQELGFFSLEGDMIRLIEQENIQKIIQEIVSLLFKVNSQKKSWEFKSYYMEQLNEETFTPSIQGVPLQRKAIFTLVHQPECSVSTSSQGYSAQAKPKLHLHTNVFVGFSLAAKAGLRFNATTSISLQVSAELKMEGSKQLVTLNIPETQNVLESNSSLYMFTKLPGQADRRDGSPRSSQMSKDCHQGLKESLGVVACIRRSVSGEHVLGNSEIQVSLRKEEQKQVVELRGLREDSGSSHKLEVRLEAPMAKTPRTVTLFALVDVEDQVKTLAVGMTSGQDKPSYMRTFQIQSSYTGTSSAHEYFLAAFFAKSEHVNGVSDKVFEVRAHTRQEEETTEVTASVKTMNALKDSPLLDIELDSEIEYSNNRVSWISIRKAEFDLGAGRYRTRNSIRSSSNPMSVKVLSKTTQDSTTVADLKLDWVITGLETPANSFKSETEGTLTTRKNSYSLVAVAGVEDKNVHLASLNIKKNKKNLVDLEVFKKVSHHSNSKFTSLRASVNMPGRLSAHSLEGGITENFGKPFSIDVNIKRQQELLFVVKGRGEWEYTSFSDFREKSSIIISSSNREKNYELDSAVQVSQDSFSVELEASNSAHKQILRIDALHQSSPRKISCSLKLDHPSFVSWNTKMSYTDQSLITAVDVDFIKQNRRVKSSSKVSFESKKAVGTILIDADKDPKKKLEYDLVYDLDKSAKSAALRGDIQYESKKYHIDTQTKLECLTDKARQANVVDIKILTPSQRELVVVAKLDRFLDQENNLLYKNASLYVHPLSEKTYLVDVVTLQQEQTADMARTLQRLLIQTPSAEVSLAREFEGPIDASLWSMEPSIRLTHDLAIKVRNLFKSTARTVQNNGQVKSHATIVAGKFSMSAEWTPEKRFQALLSSNGKAILRVNTLIPTPGQWILNVDGKAPASPVDLHAESLMKDKRVKIISRGMVNINVHPGQKQTAAELIVLKKSPVAYGFVAVMITPGSPAPFMVAMDIISDSQRAGIEMILGSARSENYLLEMNVQSKKSSSQARTFEVSIKCPSHGMEVVASTESRSSEKCMGYTMEGVVRTQKAGSYEVEAAACGPSYLQVGVKRPNQKLWNVAKVGLRSYSSLVLAIEKIYQSGVELSAAEQENAEYTFDIIRQEWTSKKTLAMAGVRVRNKRIMSLASSYNKQEISQFVQRDLPSGVKHLSSFFNAIQETTRQTVQKLVPQKVKFVPSINQLIEDLSTAWKTRISPLFGNLSVQKAAQKVLECVEKIHEKMNKIWNKASSIVNNTIKYITGKSLKDISELFPTWKSLHKKWNKATVEGANWVFNKVATIKFDSSIWNFIKKFLIDNREEIIKELDEFNDKFVPTALHFISDPIFDAFEDWLNNLTQMLVQPFLGPLTHDMGMSVSRDSAWIAISIPLRSPVSSLSAALTNIGISRSQSSSQRALGRLVSGVQMESVAMYSERRAVSLNGLEIPIVESRCEIQLCEGLGARLSVQELGGGSRVVRLSVNERQVKLRSSPGKPTEILEPPRAKWVSKEIQLRKLNHGSVKMETDAMVVIVSDVSVSVHPKLRSFNKLSGLLQVYQPESMGVSSSHGVLSHSAPRDVVLHADSAREIISRNRVDRSCKIPSRN